MSKNVKFALSRAGLASAVVGIAILGTTAGSAGAAEGFSALAGSWTGGGTISMANGGSERLRCKANYSVGGGGASATQDLRCASDSYQVNIQSNVALNGSAVVGTWTETSRGVSGQIKGSLNGSNVAATIIGPAFSASLGIGTRGSSQTININVQGGDVRSVSLNLKKN